MSNSRSNSLGNIHAEFISGVGWRVTPTAYIATVFNKRILVDCGLDPKEGILKIPNPHQIDAVLLTHAHVDHIGSLLYFYLANRDCPIFVPQGSKKAIKISLIRGYEIQNRWTENEQEFKNCTKWLQDARELLAKFMFNYSGRNNHSDWDKKMNKQGRKQQSIAHEKRQTQINIEIAKKEHDREHAKTLLTEKLWLEWYDVDGTADLRDLAAQYDIEWKWTKQQLTRDILNKIISLIYRQKMKNLADSHIITRNDVDKCIEKIQELTLGRFHRIFDNEKEQRQRIEIMPLNSGHLYSSTAWMYVMRVGWKSWIKILLTGDIWNQSLPDPYPKIDISPLEIRDKTTREVIGYQKMDCIVSEGTYGYMWEHNYEQGMKQFEAILIESIRKKRDIVIPVISLDRPLYGMWEIVTRLFEKWSEAGKEADIKPEEVDILYVGQDMQSYFPIRENNTMWKKIQKHWGHLERDRILSQKWKKPRIIFAAGGFIQPESPAAWILLQSLKICDTQIVVINYCGEKGSNGDNAISGKEFTVIEKLKWSGRGEKVERTLQLSWAQEGHRISGLSGHADGKTIVWLWWKLAKNGAKIFIQHSSDPARRELKEKATSHLREKGLEIILPRKGRKYPIKKIAEKK